MGSGLQRLIREGKAPASAVRAAARPAIRLSPNAAGQPLGLDVSGYQGNVNWSTVKSDGAQFAYVKATESTSYISPYYAQQYNGSAQAGLIRGAYHFAVPNDSSGSAQADYFVDHGGNWSPDGKTLPGALDIEYNPYGSECYGLSQSGMVSWVSSFVTEYHNRTGTYPVIYSTADWWNTCTGNSGAFSATDPLWIACYCSAAGTMGSWSSPAFWQYASSGTLPGDQDLFNGSAAGLAALAGGARRSALSMSAGGDVVFVNTSGQVVNDWHTTTGWHGPAGIGGVARADSPIVENSAGNDVVFIATNGEVVNDWATSTGWHGPEPIGGVARAGSPLSMSQKGDVVFVATNGDVVNDWSTSTGWHGPAGIGGVARADSPIVENSAGTGVVFVATNGDVVNDWYSGGWHGPAGIGGVARAGSPVAETPTNSDVVFVSGNGDVVNDWYSGGAWHGPAGIGGVARADSPIAENTTGTGVVFVGTNGAVVNDWYAGGWKGPAGIGGVARAGSPIAENPAGTEVVFVGTNGAVVNDWYAGGWKGPAGIGGTAG